MTILSAAVCNKQGNFQMARQFVDMSRSKTQAIWSSFSKLIDHDSKHCSFETPECRFIYQHLDNHVVAIATNFNSNVLVDFDILNTLVRIVSDALQGNHIPFEEVKFDLIHKFDEVITPTGQFTYANLPDIQKAVDMDSHEARVAEMIRASQESEARAHAKRKAEQLRKQRKEMEKMGGGSSFGGQGNAPMAGMGSNGANPTNLVPDSYTAPLANPNPEPEENRSGGGFALKKKKNVGGFGDLATGLELKKGRGGGFLQPDIHYAAFKVMQKVQFKSLEQNGNIRGKLEYSHNSKKKVYGLEIRIRQNPKRKLKFTKHVKTQKTGEEDGWDLYKVKVDPRLMDAKPDGDSTLIQWQGSKCVEAPEIEVEADDGLDDDTVDIALNSTGDFDDETEVAVSFNTTADEDTIRCEVDDEEVQLQTKSADGQITCTWRTTVDNSATVSFPGCSSTRLMPLHLAWDCPSDIQITAVYKNDRQDTMDLETDVDTTSRAQATVNT